MAAGFDLKEGYYDNRPLSDDEMWSAFAFIKEDNLLNFVLACPECNNKKRDKLAGEIYLDRLEERNNHLIEMRRPREVGQYSSVRRIYAWAIDNGYSKVWVPKKQMTGI